MEVQLQRHRLSFFVLYVAVPHQPPTSYLSQLTINYSQTYTLLPQVDCYIFPTDILSVLTY